MNVILPIMEVFCKSLPKIELHAHLNGSLSNKTLLSLGCQESDAKEYQKLTQLLSKSSRTLDECFQLFAVAHQTTNNIDAVYKATQSVIRDFDEDGAVYMELRTTPRAETSMTRKEYVLTVIQAIQDMKENAEIVVKLILCLDRKFDGVLTKEVMTLIIEMHNLHPDIVIGVDLCGNPKVGVFPQQEFLHARQAGLKVTLHCGEIKSGIEEVEMINFLPDRIGHGTYLHAMKGNNHDTFNVDQLRNIPLEICLSSNVICGTVDSFSNHHIKKWIEHKLPFCICTDDKGVFLSDLSKEYLLAHQYCDLSPEELYKLSYESINYIFADETVKGQLRRKFQAWRSINMMAK